MPKTPKVQAGYIPSAQVALKGTSCDTCRDFIVDSSECVIVDPPRVSGPCGTCIDYVHGRPQATGRPQRLVPKAVVGYLEGPGVPTKCARCKYYEHPGKALSTCAKVGDTENDTVQAGGCCNMYDHAKGT